MFVTVTLDAVVLVNLLITVLRVV